MPNYDILTKSPVFRGLNSEQLSDCLRTVHIQMKSFRKDSLIVNAGEKVNQLYIIQKGSVRGEMLDYSGKVLKIEDIEAPRALAGAFIFGKSNVYPVTVTANNDVELLSIPKNEFLKLMQKEQTILINYLNDISTRTQFLSNKLHFLSFRTIRGKIAHYLMQESGSNSNTVELKHTQQQLAELFGVTRPSLARVLGELQREGLIVLGRKNIVINEKKRLSQLLEKD